MNDNAVCDPVKTNRYREASEWLLRLGTPGAAEEDIEKWLRWCEADCENLAAFEKIQGDWQDAEGFIRAPQLLAAPSSATGRRLRFASPWVRWAAAAGLAAAAFLMWREWQPDIVRTTVSTSAHEPAVLPDGSSLQLSAKAIADVHFSQDARIVELSANGEAYIRVQHDRARPFTVRAGAMTVTAIGTAFDVRRDRDRVMVTVEEGAVIAAVAGADGTARWRAGAGYQVTYSDDARIARVSRVDPQAVLRWRDGELAYEDAALESVIADINRYSSASITIRDPAVGQLRFTGTVFVSSVNDWIRALEMKYPLRIVSSPDGRIEIESSVSPAPR